MDTTSKVLLSLLRSSLWSTAPDPVPADVDWAGVMKLASRQTVMGLVADAVVRLPESARPDADIMHRLKMMRVGNIRSHALLNAKLAEVLELFRSAGIRPILFKGQGLAANYPDPTARQCGDLDIYVGDEAYDKACALAVEKYGTHREDSETLKHYHLKSDEVEIEIHRLAVSLPGFLTDRKYQKWTLNHLHHSELRKLDIGGVVVEVPPVGFDSVYILNHAWHHFINGGIGLRQVCDWVLYLHRFHKQIDPVQLKKDLKDFRLEMVWKRFSYIAVNHLGLPSDECPLYEDDDSRLTAKVLQRILDEGNFGKHSRWRKQPRPKNFTMSKIHSFKIATARYMELFTMFPVMAIRYYCHFLSSGIWHYFKGLK